MSFSDFPARLRARIPQDVVVTDAQTDQLKQYFDLLSKWNQTINLTALPLDPPSDEALDRLFIEPLIVASQIDNSPNVWFDLGSGGGSPAIPIKIVRPALRLTMVESRTRKAAFLREVIRMIGLGSSEVENVRFEEMVGRADLTGSADLVTVRAVRIDREVLDVCRRLLTVGGELMLLGCSDIPDDTAGFAKGSHPGTFVRCST